MIRDTVRKARMTRGRSFTELEQGRFEQGARYNRRGIVISNSADQMQSMFIEPNTSDVYVFRIDVHGNLPGKF